MVVATEAHMVCKRMVRILLEYFLVVNVMAFPRQINLDFVD